MSSAPVRRGSLHPASRHGFVRVTVSILEIVGKDINVPRSENYLYFFDK